MGEFSTGNVIRMTFAQIGRHPAAFAAAAFLLSFLPNLAGAGSGTVTLTTRDADRHILAASSTFAPLGSGAPLVISLLSLVIYGIVVQAALDDAAGGRAIGDTIIESLRAYPTNLGITVLSYLAVILGTVALVVPGIVLQCLWLVVVPVSMAERTGVIGAFRRSRALTAGHRWRIFGLLLLYFIGVLAALGLVIFGLRGSDIRAADGGAVWTVKVLSSAAAAVLGLVGSAGAMATYIELRTSEAGPPGPDPAAAFE